MNKRKSAMALCVASFASLGAVVIGASYKAAGNLFFAKADAAGVWVHYAKKAASKGSDGIREYWVSCQTNEHVFVAPSDATIQEATSYDTSGFATDDDRWIKAVTLSAQEVLMTDSTKTFDLGEYAGGTVSSIKAGTFDLGTDASNLDVSGFAADHSDDGVKAVEVETTKDGKEYVLYFDTTFVTSYITNTADSFKTLNPIMTTEDDHCIKGYYKLTEDISLATFGNCVSEEWISGWATDQSHYVFMGTLDGNNKTINGKTINNYGFFCQIEGATIKNLTYNDYYFREMSQNYPLFAAGIRNTKFENVKVKMLGGKTDVTFEPDLTTANWGWIAKFRFMSNTLTNCDFDATGYRVPVVFSSQNGNDNTFTDCSFKADTFGYLWNHYQKGHITAWTGLTVTGNIYTAAA